MTIRSRGATGGEILQVRDGLDVIGEFTTTTEWTEVDISVDPALSFDELAVGFINNDPHEHNAFVDWVQLGSERREAEDPTVWSTGAWSSATGCINGPASNETLTCAGFLYFGGEPDSSTITVEAVGTTGTENLELLIDGISLATQRVTSMGDVSSSATPTTTLQFGLPEQVDPDRIDVVFVNAGTFEGVERDVRIDSIEIDGVQLSTPDSTEILEPTGPPAPLPLSVEVFADGLTHPWGMDFLPTGELLFAERLGRLNVATDSGVSPVEADFNNIGIGSSGLLGLAVDANFETNRRFYTCQGQDSPLRLQIHAWELDSGLSTATKVESLVDIERTGAHSGCRLRIDSDGYLWATFGDDFIADAAQDLNSLNGKVLRIDPLTGLGHPDNLNAGPERDARIFSLGHRNVQGLSFHPVTGQPWISDHGPDIEDEINALVAGGNYGWDPVGPEGPSVYDELGRSATDTSIAGAIPAAWNSGSSTIAPGGIAFLSGSEWGDFNGAIAMTTLKDQRLHLLRFDSNGVFFDRTVPVELDVSEYRRLRSALVGPDGALYLSTSNSGFSNEDDRRRDSILRVTPAETSTSTDLVPNEPLSAGATTLTVVARGRTGSERLHLDIDGVEVAQWTTETTFSSASYVHPTPVSGSQVRVRFSNDELTGAVDPGVLVDYLVIGGERFDSEHPTVRSLGASANGAQCREGTFNTDFLECNGWFQYADDGGFPLDGDRQIEVRAEGDTGEERIELRIDGAAVATFNLTTNFETYTYNHPTNLNPNTIQIAFINDGRTSDGTDKNVEVDYITVNGTTYQTEDPSVLSTGTYTRNNGCAPGNKQDESLHCQGHFEYTIR